ncbi:S-type anion channel like [Thalictrum thalictroides]|uniref:S-type anion channel like n=1 Tax=Thalictrum thalictroides TaxID=46969 RepID=A0A7J6VC21_THATH|nr:S-type anion channel like [Thalictrum thalictroides]
MDIKHLSTTQVELVIDPSSISTTYTVPPLQIIVSKKQSSSLSILARLHAGYFRITFSLCSQALLLKRYCEPYDHDQNGVDGTVLMFPSRVIVLVWLFAFLTLALLSLCYILKCVFYLKTVKAEFLHHVGVNYLFAPWISWLLLLEAAPFITKHHNYYVVLWWVFTLPIVALDVKIYGQWFTKGKRFLSTVANPTSQLSVIGNLVSARAAAEMGWKETALCLFSLGMVHYLVLFVTLYQRTSGNQKVPVLLRPVFFLFFAAPSMASLAWYSISGAFDTAAKMLFFLSIFLFASLVSRPALFRKSMRKFNVTWWAYSFPLTVLALASDEYVRALEMHSSSAHGLTLAFAALSVLVSVGLLMFTMLNTNKLFPEDVQY